MVHVFILSYPGIQQLIGHSRQHGEVAHSLLVLYPHPQVSHSEHHILARVKHRLYFVLSHEDTMLSYTFINLLFAIVKE